MKYYWILSSALVGKGLRFESEMKWKHNWYSIVIFLNFNSERKLYIFHSLSSHKSITTWLFFFAFHISKDLKIFFWRRLNVSSNFCIESLECVITWHEVDTFLLLMWVLILKQNQKYFISFSTITLHVVTNLTKKRTIVVINTLQ